MSTPDDIGLEDGRRWARNKAKPAELERLVDLYDKAGSDWGRIFDPTPNDAYAAAEHFFFTIEPDSEGDREAARDFWQFVLGDVADDLIQEDGYIQGFAEGALDALDENQP